MSIGARAHVTNIITFLLIVGLSLYMCKECHRYGVYNIYENVYYIGASATLLAGECKYNYK